jgi:hypothetical protein
MSEFLNNYFQNRFFNVGVGEFLDRSPLAAPVVPFANPFADRKKPRFPVPSDFERPAVEMEVLPSDIGDGGSDFYSPGYDPTTGERRQDPNVEPIDPLQGMGAYVVDEVQEKTGIKAMITSAIENELGFPTKFDPITGTERVSDISKSLGTISMGMTPLGAFTQIGAEYNAANLSDIAAKAALGQKGYAVGMFENQIVGTKPSAAIVQGTYTGPEELQNKVKSQLQELAAQGKGAGVLGKAYEQYTTQGGRFDMTKPMTPEMLAYENVVKSLDIDDKLKANLLGYGTRVPDAMKPTNYYNITPYEQVQKDIEKTKRYRTGNVDPGSFTDVSAPSMGLETDLVAQQSMVNPMGINLGIDMDNITGVPTGVNVPSYVDTDYGNNDGGGSDPSSPSSSDMGFSTKYGGKIGMLDGGFASKTKIIKGVGLIKPEETFMDTDVVDDRYRISC